MKGRGSTRRRFFRLAGGSAGTLALAACDRLPGVRALLPGGAVAEDIAPFSPPAGATIDLVTHALNRLTWGPFPGEYARVASLGSSPGESVRLFAEEQLEPGSLDDSRVHAALAPLEAIREPVAELYEYKPAQLQDELTRQAVIRAAHSRRQLYEVMVAFWSEHFNIDSSKTDCRWFKTVDDRSVIRPHALGNFRTMLKASALSPAMLVYLDGRANRRRNPAERPNENYARELLELHTLGVHGGYTQNDVMEAARCLTGWTVAARETRNGLKDITMGLKALAGENQGGGIGRVYFDAGAHDDGPKTVLGQSIPAGGGPADLDRLLDVVVNHPSTARFIAAKLCRHFISDEPPASAVEVVAAAFRKHQGEIRPVLRALIATPEFQDPTVRGMRIKRPFHFIVSALRSTGASTRCGPAIQRSLTVMGHAPFHYPTPEGPAPDGESWLSTLLHRWDFASRLCAGELQCTALDAPRLTACAGGRDGLLRHLFGRLPDATEKAAADAVQDTVAMALAAPAFQVF